MKVKPSPIIDDMSGKLGTVVFTKGRSGLNARKKSKPGNPQSAAQVLVRSYMKEWSEKWRLLLPAEILSWNQAALQAKKSNRFGDKYHMTGNNMYCAFNCENSFVGNNTEITTPPSITVPTMITATAIDFDSTGTPHATVTLSGVVPTGSLLQIWVSPMLSAGVSNFKGKPTFIQSVAAGGGATPVDIIAAYTAKYGTLIPNTKVAVQCYLNNADSPHFVVKFKAGSLLAGKVK